MRMRAWVLDPSGKYLAATPSTSIIGQAPVMLWQERLISLHQIEVAIGLWQSQMMKQASTQIPEPCRPVVAQRAPLLTTVRLHRVADAEPILMAVAALELLNFRGLSDSVHRAREEGWQINANGDDQGRMQNPSGCVACLFRGKLRSFFHPRLYVGDLFGEAPRVSGTF
jgi:hypothetical protein